jgi:hypothetical protein
MIVFCMVHLLSTEFNPSQRSKGDVLVFPRKYSVIQHEQLKDVEKSDQPIFSHDTSVKKSKIRHVGHEGANPEPSMTKLTQSQGAVIHWNKLGYKVKTHDSKPHILSDIHGWVKPGTLTALMVSFSISLPMHLPAQGKLTRVSRELAVPERRHCLMCSRIEPLRAL